MITKKKDYFKVKANNFEVVDKFKYLGTIITNGKEIREDIKERFNSGNACNYGVNKLLSSRQLSKKITFLTSKIIIQYDILWGSKLVPQYRSRE